MKRYPYHRKCITHTLDNKWIWSSPVWFTTNRTFADVTIESPAGKTFDSENEACYNMNQMLAKLDIETKRRVKNEKKNIC
jgi:hypothetical protein